MFNFYIMMQLNNIYQIIINNMKKTKYNIKTNNLSPSIEGSRNFEKISQSLDAKNFSQKTETPFVLVVCNRFLDILGFDTIINESIRWDQDQWKVPPCKLARSIILTPFLRVDKRCPLYRIEDGFEGMDLNLLFEGNYLPDDFNDDHLGKLLNKKNLEVIYADESPIKFISSCPSSFSSKIAGKTRKEAYLLDNWEDIGICCENEKSKRAARYKAQSFVKPVHERTLRLIVIKGNDPENKVIKNIEKEKKSIEADIKKSFNKPFACKPDAQKAIDDFLKKHKNSLFDIKLEIDKIINEYAVYSKSGKVDHLHKLLELLGLHSEPG